MLTSELNYPSVSEIFDHHKPRPCFSGMLVEKFSTADVNIQNLDNLKVNLEKVEKLADDIFNAISSIKEDIFQTSGNVSQAKSADWSFREDWVTVRCAKEDMNIDIFTNNIIKIMEDTERKIREMKMQYLPMKFDVETIIDEQTQFDEKLDGTLAGFQSCSKIVEEVLLRVYNANRNVEAFQKEVTNHFRKASEKIKKIADSVVCAKEDFNTLSEEKVFEDLITNPLVGKFRSWLSECETEAGSVAWFMKTLREFYPSQVEMNKSKLDGIKSYFESTARIMTILDEVFESIKEKATEISADSRIKGFGELEIAIIDQTRIYQKRTIETSECIREADKLKRTVEIERKSTESQIESDRSQWEIAAKLLQKKVSDCENHWDASHKGLNYEWSKAFEESNLKHSKVQSELEKVKNERDELLKMQAEMDDLITEKDRLKSILGNKMEKLEGFFYKSLQNNHKRRMSQVIFMKEQGERAGESKFNYFDEMDKSKSSDFDETDN